MLKQGLCRLSWGQGLAFLGYTSMVKVQALLLATLLLSSCSQLNPLSFLSGGTNVAANTQVGKENNQTVGVVSNTRPQLRVEAPVEQVVQDTSTNNTTEVDPLMLLLLILGWLAPSPSEISRSFLKLFKRKS
jgi:hypothetical protein